MTFPFSRWTRVPGCALVAGLLLLGCSEENNPVTIPEDPTCPLVDLAEPAGVSECLLLREVISSADRDSSTTLFNVASAKADSFRQLGGATNLEKAARIARSLSQITGFHRRDLLNDSARFHRIMDGVSVAIEISEDRVAVVGGKLRPSVTPFLVWYSYPGIGAYFQPVTTTQTVAHLLPRSDVPTDSLINIADALYRYAIWREHAGKRFPVWEYQFTWTSGGITVESPWISGMAQGLVMSVFAEVYRRTGSPEWKDRVYQVLNSFQVTWSNGGVMLDDTTHGYWWEEFHPEVQVWNGSVQALIDVGFVWSVTQDSMIKRMYDRGLESVKHFTPDYDTGSWTLYSRTQGHNSVAYHNYHIGLMDALYTQTNDLWFKTTADRWRAYQPPPGVR
jgi:hypothetical protein